MRYPALLAMLLAGLHVAPPALSADIHDAVNAGNLEDVKRIISANPARVNEAEMHGWTPLFLASATGYRQMVEYLLDNGATLDAKDLDGDTALHEAAGNARLPIVALLLKRGAKVQLINNAGMTALHRVARDGYKPDHLAIVDLLLQHGASLQAKDKENRTPLALAIDTGRMEVAALLQKKAN